MTTMQETILNRRKAINPAIPKKSFNLLLGLTRCVIDLFKWTNDFFGLDDRDSKVWFYGTYSFVIAITLIVVA